MTTSSPRRRFTLGAVAYDPKVVTIWEGFKDWFAGHDFAFDYVLFSNYETQAEAHLAGMVDVTWDSPLAWVRTRRLAAAAGRAAHAVAMRDSDQDLTSVVLVRADSSVADAVAALTTGREDAPLRMLQSKAIAGDAALDVLDIAMRIGGGAAFRKDIGIERHFRDARAAVVMAPTTDALHEFLGRALCGLPLFG